MNKHEAAVTLELIKAGRPILALLVVMIVKLPWRYFTGIGSVAALGASLRWHDAGWVWRLLP